MKKLTRAQLAILRRLATGEVLRTKWVGSWPVYRWDSEPDKATRVHGDTLNALLRAGFVTSIGGRYLWWPDNWSITPAGRAYLEELRRNDAHNLHEF